MIEDKFRPMQSISENQKGEILNQLKDFLENDKRVIFAYLFGSFIEYDTLAAKVNLISDRLAEKLHKLIDLRNLITHRCWKIDDAKLYTISKSNSEDIGFS